MIDEMMRENRKIQKYKVEKKERSKEGKRVVD